MTESSPIYGATVTASKLNTARSSTLSGDVSGTTDFDGSSNVSISTALPSKFVNDSTFTCGIGNGADNVFDSFENEIKSQKSNILIKKFRIYFI